MVLLEQYRDRLKSMAEGERRDAIRAELRADANSIPGPKIYVLLATLSPVTPAPTRSAAEFTFEGRTGLEYPADDPETEATHMAWLENELAKRNLCPNGYKITDKTEIAAAGGEVIGQTYNIAYAGVCK